MRASKLFIAAVLFLGFIGQVQAIERQRHTRFSSMVVTGAALFADGTVGAPSIAFSSENDGTGMGFYRSAANQVGVVVNGVNTANFIATGFNLPHSGANILFSHSANTLATINGPGSTTRAMGFMAATTTANGGYLYVSGTANATYLGDTTLASGDVSTGDLLLVVPNASAVATTSIGGTVRTAVNAGGLDVTGEVSISGAATSTGVLCTKSDGDIGQCTSAVGAGGTCTCA